MDGSIVVPEWRISPGLTPYPEALAGMESRAEAIRAGEARELIWLLEHPPLYTSGTSADRAELMNPLALPVFEAGRGGRYTYHGPGQRVVYVMLDLEKRGRDLRRFVHALEDWVIEALALLGIAGRRDPERIGIWTDCAHGSEKIGAIGVRVRRWVTMHGFSVNAAPELSHFSGIVPCGISDFGVTSLEALGVADGLARLDAALEQGFPDFLGSLKSASFAAGTGDSGEA